ncbi:hypothetical protein C0Q70_09141 [Pomacea canaliculata]|uniref:Uncharacterized protein n=1 Tax=Pomacea canaliculata TaxID=400727 RepID=A0A2T7P8Z4_POMCA|nr:hypothetical protein C0Q70_09141 [Pomacea canaliculata]
MSTELISAAKNGYHSKVMALLSEGEVDVNGRDKDRATALYWSACRGNAAICRALIKAGCDVNASVKWGSTALHAASDRNNVECLKALIDSGVDVDMQNERGDTALHLAAYRGFRDIVEHLLSAGANPFSKNLQNKTPLQEAQSRQHASTVSILQLRMEELGCIPFKSLQHPQSGTVHADDRPGPSVQAKSWPHYQVHPRLLESEVIYKHTKPIGMNNLSTCQPAKSSETAMQLGQDRTLYRQGEVRGLRDSSTGLNDLNSGGDICLYTHSEPEESVDDSVDGCNSHKMADIYGQHNILGNLSGKPSSHKMLDHHGKNGVRPTNTFVHDGRSAGSDCACHQNGFMDTNVDLLLNCVPTYHGQVTPASSPLQCVRCSSGARTSVNGVFLPPPDITVPGHGISVPRNSYPASSRQLNIDDLAVYAQSLQMEVVRLRETVTSKDAEIADMRKKLAALEKQNCVLQQMVKNEQEACGKVIAFKESEVSEFKRRTVNLENLIATLEHAIDSKDEITRDALGVKENEIKVLKLKLSFLETQVTNLQQLVVSKDEAANKTLCEKDKELQALQCKLQALEKENARILDEFGSRCEAPSNDRSSCDIHSPVNIDVSSREMQTSGVRETHPCCAAVPQLTTSHFAVLFSELRRQHDRRWVDAFLEPLKTKLAASLQKEEVVVSKLDADGREWRLDRDFRLLDPNPINCSDDGQRRGSCSLVFSIEHKGNRFILKEACVNENQLNLYYKLGELSVSQMLANLINLQFDSHSRGRSLDAHLLYSFGTEFLVPLLLNGHPNIVRVRHHFQGDTTHFRSYLPLLVPPSLGTVPRDMAPGRTTSWSMDGRKPPCDPSWETIPFEDAAQVCAGNSHAWAPELSRLNRKGPQSLSQSVTLDHVYAKTDAFAVSRMMFHLLRPIWDDPHSDNFPASTQLNPHYQDLDIPSLLPPFSPALCHTLALKQLGVNDPRPTGDERQGRGPPSHQGVP